MILRVDAEGQKAVNDLCDIALKSAGLQIINGVLAVLRGVEVIDGSTGGSPNPGPVGPEGS